jgi:hypothetical protein
MRLPILTRPAARPAAALLSVALCVVSALAETQVLTTAAPSAVPAHAPTLLSLKGQALSNGTIAYPFGAVRVSAIWRSAEWTEGGDKPIDVCWERPNDVPAYLRDSVRDAVARTWAYYGMVSFRGWGACADGAKGIRIGVSSDRSGTDGLGQQLDGKPNGMLLQMDFSASTYCLNRNEFCVRATAVHEFGHALGIVHEQNRPDAPDWCKAKHQGEVPDKSITKYDPDSIMNYCNKTWQNDGLLSDSDIVTVTTLYGGRA